MYFTVWERNFGGKKIWRMDHTAEFSSKKRLWQMNLATDLVGKNFSILATQMPACISYQRDGGVAQLKHEV